MFVLTKGKSKEYPDLQEINNINTLVSLKDEKKAKEMAEKIYLNETGEQYPHIKTEKKDATHQVLKKLFNEII
jgi:hypothetical protein